MKNKILKFLFPIPTIVITAICCSSTINYFGFIKGAFITIIFFIVAMLPLDLILWIVYQIKNPRVKEVVKVKCPNCGKLLSDDCQWCTECGYQLSKPASQSSTAVTQKSIIDIDNMNGYEFERFCAQILQTNGFYDINVTKASGDQGVDVIALKDGIRCAIQCKRYSSNVGNKAVQEVVAGMQYYNCQIGIVMTNSYFTQSAKDLASRAEIILWDRDFLYKYVVKQQVISPELEAQGQKILQDMARIYTTLFQENMHVNVVLVNANFKGEDIELIYKCDTNEQVKYLVSQQNFLTEKLHSQQYFTELSNNYMSVIIKT